MSRPRIPFDRRGTDRVAAVTPGPRSSGRSRFEGGEVALPVVLVSALAAAGVSVAGFLDRLVRGAIWQDDAIRSPDREIVIQAHLARGGLRCVIQIGEWCWYHHPLDALHLFGIRIPATAMALTDVPLASIVSHDLLDGRELTVRSLSYLNTSLPDLGTCILLHVPTITVPVTRSSR